MKGNIFMGSYPSCCFTIISVWLIEYDCDWFFLHDTLVCFKRTFNLFQKHIIMMLITWKRDLQTEGVFCINIPKQATTSRLKSWPIVVI